ncbi:GyrI-like domain-containing protein [Chitinophaga pendula]|uniref:GyrI-like domain-containing protein n=1 Tax=Chitinophaga TaxID=79328 RepID=UPI000BAF39AB|nr:MULTISPECIES: GyrI-like domain-containing protein [Chitinophaga]ASZ09959.1 hypothetical protein CK934_02675 [Chitinophaga sp. MD30]UCJ07099.1 GyrI-like domain-containing protein [Chitinophaga pendula]
MQKIDLLKQYKTAYSATTQPQLIHVEEAAYISLPGKGDPNGPLFAESTQALYTTAYSIKMGCKAANMDFIVPKLEGLWWLADEVEVPASDHLRALNVSRDLWRWQLLIRMPAFVTTEMFRQGLDTAIRKKQLPLLSAIAFSTLTEGKCVQMLHIGPYADELRSIQHMHDYITENNWQQNGLHHEIYLSDPRKTAPGKMKTILRQPVK